MHTTREADRIIPTEGDHVMDTIGVRQLHPVRSLNEIPVGPLGDGELPWSIWVYVTPSMARAWLTDEMPNRHESERHSGAIARDMEAGRFDGLNAETAKFRWDEGRWRMFDAHHRFTAIAKTGHSQEILCVFGAHLLGVDKVRPRTNADQWRIAGHPQATQLSAVCRLVTIWTATGSPQKGGMLSPTDGELNEMLTQHPCITDTLPLVDRVRRAGVLKASIAGWLRFATAHAQERNCKSPDDDWFIERLIAGDGLGYGHPALTLRNRSIEDRMLRKDDLRLAAACVYAWNAYREGRELRIIQIPGSLTPATFPEVL